MKAFEILFPHIRSGGIYVIEDLAASYSDEWWGHPDLNPDRGPGNDRAAFDRFVANLMRDCDIGGADRTVAFVHSWPTLLVVGRA
jgi:hypothetical protein